MRFFLTATFAVALCGSRAAQAQSAGDSNTVAPVYSSSVSLPDAPSAALQQQQPVPAPAAQGAQTTQPAAQPPSQTGTQPPPQKAGTAAPEAPLPGETQEQFRARIHAEAEAQVKKQEGQRNLYVLPNFNSVIAGETPPLSPREKFDLVYHTAKDPYTFTIAFILAGFGEINDDHIGYHWGPAGYFRRVGAAYGDNVDGAIWGNAVLPSLLHQDPRYFRRGPGTPDKPHSLISRVLWAAGSSVICYGDNGKLQPNISNIAGNFIAGEISNLYYPDDERGTGLAFNNAVTVTLTGAVGAQLLEFGPDLTARLERGRLRQVAFKEAKAKAKAAGQPAPKLKDIPIQPLERR